MTKETPLQRAKALLKLHGGSCFVLKDSDLVEPFREMEKAGLVTMRATPREQPDGFNVYAT